MSKFKVGDRVRVKDTAGFSRGSAGVVTHVGFGSFEFGVLRDGASSSRGFDESELYPAVPVGPVRTVTRKEIVQGQFGIVSIGGLEVVPDYSNVDAKPRAEVAVTVGNLGMVFQRPTFGSAELRAAAATFIELADALDEVA